MNDIKLNFGPGLEEVELEAHYWGGAIYFDVRTEDGNDVLRVSLDAPDLEEEDPENLARGAVIDVAADNVSPTGDDLPRLHQLINQVAWMAALINEPMADRVKEAKRKQENERIAAEQLRRAQDKTWEERKERLLHEFVDTKVRARTRGYKQAVMATVRVRDNTHMEGGGFVPYIEWHNENDWNRPRDYKRIRRLEVKVGGRYKVIWDDGRDDLGRWDRGADADREHNVKPYTNNGMED